MFAHNLQFELLLMLYSPDGSRSPTPSSVSSHLSSNQGKYQIIAWMPDICIFITFLYWIILTQTNWSHVLYLVITYKKVEMNPRLKRNDKVMGKDYTHLR